MNIISVRAGDFLNFFIAVFIAPAILLVLKYLLKAQMNKVNSSSQTSESKGHRLPSQESGKDQLCLRLCKINVPIAMQCPNEIDLFDRHTLGVGEDRR